MKSRPSLERINEMLNVIPATGKVLWKKSSGRARAGSEAGRITVHGYHEVSLDGRLYFGHSIVFFAAHGWWPERVDHVNGCKTDNRIENLRCVDAATNARNRTNWVSPRGLLGAFKSASGGWAASITADGRRYHLGTFSTEAEAHQAYAHARQQCAEAEAKVRAEVLSAIAARDHLTVLEQVQADQRAAA
jgi:hypothetical protein